jgi:membrane protease YdiL (CAAX protease family)
MSRLRYVTHWIKRWPLAAYIVLVFGLEWLLVLLLQSIATPMMALFIGAWLPNIAGVLITAAADGREGLRRLFSRVVRWQVGFKWYVIAWWAPIIIVMLALSIYALSGHALPAMAPEALVIPLLLVNVVLGPLGEELGWRGTALPLLQARWNVLTSSLVLGVVWGLYHVPTFLLPGLPQNNVPPLAFLLGAVGLNIFMVWMFNHTHGSLIMPFLAHWAFNFAGSASGIYGVPTLLWLVAGLWWVIAAAIVLFDWMRPVPRTLRQHLR